MEASVAIFEIRTVSIVNNSQIFSHSAINYFFEIVAEKSAIDWSPII
jgi:hypothetical protein